MSKIITAVTFSFIALTLSFPAVAADIVGGGGTAAEKLILDWAKYKPEGRTNTVKFSSSISSSDLGMLQKGKIDFAILNSPLSDAELGKMNLVQFPFALSGVAVVVNLPNTLAGILRLDSQTLGKIFSGEITYWDDPAITTLNPKHDLPNKTITIVHSGNTSIDYPVFNSYIASINEKWKAGDLNGGTRVWPANSIGTDDLPRRISTIKKTPYSIGFLPMQYVSQAALTTLHIQNRDGNFVGLSDTSILASSTSVNIDDGRSESLSLINKSGSASWPISNFAFIVASKDRIKDDKIAQLFGVISYGLKFGSLKPTLHNYVPIPDQLSKSVVTKIESVGTSDNTASAGKLPPAKTVQEKIQEAPVSNTKNDEELKNRQRAEAAEEKNRAAKQLMEDREREQAIREAKAAKIAAEEATRAAKAAKIEADALAEKNRLIAKAEKEKADKEKAEKERAAKEKAEQEKAIQMRNQKDEDPLEAYRRSISK